MSTSKTSTSSAALAASKRNGDDNVCSTICRFSITAQYRRLPEAPSETSSISSIHAHPWLYGLHKSSLSPQQHQDKAAAS
jgi:hypothetical protein